MNRFEIINKVGAKYHIGNTENGEFSYVQALKSVGKDIKDYQKGTSGTQHQYLDIRFENERLVVLIETKSKFSRWDKTKIQSQLQDYVRFEKAYSDKKIVAILAETDGDDVWVWYGQSVIIDDEHRTETETVLRTFEEYENLCFGFETIFNLEKTMAKIKQGAIDEIVGTNAFSDATVFKSLASQYKSSRTFITLKPERVNRIKNKRTRKSVADMLHLPLDNCGNFEIKTAEEVSLLIRYLCFKIFQDNETKDVLEANTVTKLSIA